MFCRNSLVNCDISHGPFIFKPHLMVFVCVCDTPTRLLPPPPRTFSCSSSLPTPRPKQATVGPELYKLLISINSRAASPSDGVAVLPETVTDLVGHSTLLGGWEDIKDVEHNQEVQALGKFAVEEHNNKDKTDIKFIRVVEAERQVVAGVNYRLWIEGEVKEKVGKVDKEFKAFVFVGLPVHPKDLISFAPVKWAK